MYNNLDKIYSYETEKEIIGQLLKDQSSYGGKNLKEFIPLLIPEMFFDVRHKVIYETIQKMEREGKPIDIISVSEQLKFENKLNEVGGRSYINDCALYSMPINIAQSVKTVIKYYKKREVLNLLDNTRNEIDIKDVDDIVDNIITISEKVKSLNVSSNMETLTDGFNKTYEIFEQINYSSKSVLGLETGFYSLDKNLSGLCPGRLYIIGARPSVGKALSLDTNILTPTGWVKNKDIKLGDIIIGRNGKPTKVIGVYPQGVTNNYTLTLKDGRTIDCCEHHEWTVYSSKWGKEKTFTTKELYNKLQCVRYKNRISLPRFTGNYGMEKDFIIPPYVMGVLIGDGCLTSGMCYCKSNPAILNKIQSLLPQSDVHFGRDKKKVYITKFLEGLNYIRRVGLNTQCYNKFMPQEYFHSSKKQREELFQGLMDTDGWKFNTGWEYSTSSKQLALDVQQLAWSLGYSAKVKIRMGKYKKNNQTKETRLNYRVFITTHKPLTIVDIQPTKSFETQCIHVDNEDHLFVIEDYIVTHNSAFAQQIAENIAVNNNVLFVSLEMGTEEYTQRSLYRRTGFNQEHFCNSVDNVRQQIMNSYKTTGEQLSNLNLYIYNNPSCNLKDIEKNLISMNNKKQKCDLLLIDYLQLLEPVDKSLKDGYTIVTENSKTLKKIARKYNIPVVVLSQLSRSLEMRGDKRPILSDLRESGSIEQDADVVLFLYRPDLYNSNPVCKNTAELIIAKNRQGRRDVVIPLTFNGSRVEFKELSYGQGT